MAGVQRHGFLGKQKALMYQEALMICEFYQIHKTFQFCTSATYVLSNVYLSQAELRIIISVSAKLRSEFMSIRTIVNNENIGQFKGA